METGRVVCEIGTEAEETVEDLNVTDPQLSIQLQLVPQRTLSEL